MTEYYGPTKKGGEGQKFSSSEAVWDYQVTCYKEEEKAPEWYREGIFYQIFPDRFANGNPDQIINSPKKILIFMLPKKMIRYMSKMQMAKFYAGIFLEEILKVFYKKSLT
ncbi:hypothetical protein GCM10025853_10190 [Tetragenococcus halophilus subsp. halophilus DSM 20339]|nr:hypothetical protein GCM10025853_10190 [Tetragenococcus halophilus subsp. halophilus DSM 20339]